jgi:hypothetical protein
LLLLRHSKMYSVPVSDKFHWRDLLPNRTSMAVMAVALVVIEYLLKKGILWHQ